MKKRLFATAVLAAGALFASAGAALAVQIVMMQSEKVYATQDASQPPIGTIAKGTIGEANCVNGGWCFVDQPAGVDGWVSASGVDTVANQTGPGKMFPGPAPVPPAGGGGGPTFSFDFGFGKPPVKPKPPRPPKEPDEVCFYTGADFTGRSFCAEPDDASNRLSSRWDNAISSIEVFGDAEVDVCTDRNMRGSCTTITRDTARLSSRFNDRITSFEVY